MDTTLAHTTPTHFVGIGASAGGLEALQQFLQKLPSNTDACFIIVQHLSPDFKSMMLELLSKHTDMHVETVSNGILARPNCIYLLPAKKVMMISGGKLLLSDKTPHSGVDLPIDLFLNSLAEDKQHKAIGIILSGTGSDGSQGVKSIKEQNGLVVCQSPESAKFDGMPLNAINSVVVDLVLSPDKIGRAISDYILHPLIAGQDEHETHDFNSDMSEILNLLKIKSSMDFERYKTNTIRRRIERRMVVMQKEQIKDYKQLLMQDEAELNVLSKELLIGVTRFFRDGESFTALSKEVIAGVVAACSVKNMIRIWVAACSTGEEAYTIAILLKEELKKQNIVREVKIFATDLDADAIGIAGMGLYSENIKLDVSPYVLNEYFEELPNGDYQITQAIRNMVVFAKHNMLIDPPFSNLDLVTCRNVLIYFQQDAQKKALSAFHFALKKDGYLFLGSSESLGELSGYFDTVGESKHKIYIKNVDTRLTLSSVPPNPSQWSKSPRKIASVSSVMENYSANRSASSTIGFVNEAIIADMLPPSVILNAEFQALHVHGDMSLFVKRLPPGRISTDIGEMVNEDLSIAVKACLTKIKQDKRGVLFQNLETQSHGRKVHMQLRGNYFKEHDIESTPTYYWLIFEEIDHIHVADNYKEVTFNVSDESRQRIELLEVQLEQNEEDLRITIEELETTNEELQSTNEELMSANEELQSTNEELQSVNEELYSVNSEHQEKIAEISQAKNDLDEILGLSKIGIIFLDDDLKIRRYTQTAKEYVNLQPTDIRRPIHHLTTNIEYKDLIHDVTNVYQSGDTSTTEIAAGKSQQIKVSITRYQYSDIGQSTGIAIIFTDVTRTNLLEQGLSVSYHELKQSISNALDKLDKTPFTNKINMLLVDNSSTALDFFTAKLKEIKSFPVSVSYATSIEEANTLLNQQTFDICICDYYLENENAIDLIINNEEKGHDLPVIVVMTGEAKEDLYHILLAHGALDLLQKENVSTPLIERAIKYAVRRYQIDKEINGLVVQ